MDSDARNVHANKIIAQKRVVSLTDGLLEFGESDDDIPLEDLRANGNGTKYISVKSREESTKTGPTKQYIKEASLELTKCLTDEGTIISQGTVECILRSVDVLIQYHLTDLKEELKELKEKTRSAESFNEITKNLVINIETLKNKWGLDISANSHEEFSLLESRFGNTDFRNDFKTFIILFIMSSYIVVNTMTSMDSCTVEKERREFVTKSYVLTIIFLVLTCGQVFAAILTEQFRKIILEQESITYMGLSLFFFTILLFFTFRDVRVTHPCNSCISIILMESVTAVIIILSITFIKTDAFFALSIALITIVVGTLLAAVAPFDLTKYVVLLMTFILTLYVVCMITIFLAIFFMSWLLIIAFCAISLFGSTIFLMYHTQLIIGGRSFYMKADDHYFAGTILYVDSCIIFILTLCLFKPIEINYLQTI